MSALEMVQGKAAELVPAQDRYNSPVLRTLRLLERFEYVTRSFTQARAHTRVCVLNASVRLCSNAHLYTCVVAGEPRVRMGICGERTSDGAGVGCGVGIGVGAEVGTGEGP